MMPNSTSKNHTKKISNREREKNKSESGGSSQCDTPPLIEKDGTSSQGKFAGISQESVNCMAEQNGIDINSEAASNLAEDVSYKLRQIINTIASNSSMLKKSRVDSWDVNTTLMLADTSPVVGVNTLNFATFGDEDLCAQVETLHSVTDTALTVKTFNYETPPSLSVEWITDERSLNSNSSISPQLHNYYTKIARAILNLESKLKDVALEDLRSNTRIGPIFPNLFNLAVLVLNDDNLKALHVPAHAPLQARVLDMMAALASNRAALDTNIQQQFQRLFPVMVSNILSNGSLSEKMVDVLTKLTRRWPSFAIMGKETLYDYLSKGPKTQLTGQMIKCLTALGRKALIDCLAEHLDYLDSAMHGNTKSSSALRQTLLDAAGRLLRAELTTYLEDYVATDYTLYEMLGDSIMPCRTLFPNSSDQRSKGGESPQPPEDDFTYIPMRTFPKQPRIGAVQRAVRKEPIPIREVFEPHGFRCERLACRIQIKLTGCRSLPVKRDRIFRAFVLRQQTLALRARVAPMPGAPVAHIPFGRGFLRRFRYRLDSKLKPAPVFGAYVL